MSILEEMIMVKISGGNSRYYESIGYYIPRGTDKRGRIVVPKETYIEVKVNDLPLNSSVKLTKVCDYCGERSENKQHYYNIIKSRDKQSNKDCCEKCIGKKSWENKPIPEGRSLLDKFPNIAAELHPELNDLNPSETWAHSNISTWWLCKENHSYFMPICERTNEHHNCPKCNYENRKGENNHRWKGGITQLNNYLRNSCLKQWVKDSMKNCNYKCVISGERFDDIHHLYGFDLILEETFEELNMPIKSQIKNYSNEELILIKEKVLEIHYRYPLGVCLRKDIHALFHKEYGSGKNTPKQFMEFKTKYFGISK